MVKQTWEKKSLTHLLQVGHMTGATSWQKSGRDEHMAGEAEIQAAEAEAYLQGTIDRAQGKLDAVVGAVTGDRERQMEGMCSRRDTESTLRTAFRESTPRPGESKSRSQQTGIGTH